MPGSRFVFRKTDSSNGRRQISSRADFLDLWHQAGNRGAVLEQDEGDILIMSAIDAVGKIARSLSYSFNPLVGEPDKSSLFRGEPCLIYWRGARTGRTAALG